MSNTVPEEWSLLTVGNTCEVLDSKRVPINSQDRALREGIYPYYGANGVQGYIGDFIFEGEHVLLAEDGGYFDEWDSRPISYLVTGKFWVNNHAHILRAKSGHETRFIHYSLVHKNILKHINGGTRAKLNQSDMRQIEYLAPPLPEQQKIAAILSSIDDVIEKTRAQIDKLKDLKTGMMQELLTKGIGHTAFKDSPVGRIPASWDVKALGELTSLIKSGLSRRISSQDIGIPLLISGNIKHGSLDTTELRYWYVDDPQGANTSNYMLNDGDILMCFINSMRQIGKSCIFRDIGRPAIYTTNLFRIVPKKDYSSEYLQMIFMTSRFQNEIQLISKPAVNQASFTKSDLEQLYVPVPPTTERDLITQAVTSIGDKILATEHRLMGLFGIKKALMQDLLTGKVRVNVDNNNLEARVAG